MLHVARIQLLSVGLLVCLGCGPQATIESPPDLSRFGRPDDPEFVANVYESPVPVLVDFSATWCVPCQELAPVVHHLETEYAGRLKVVTIDVDENPDLSAHYEVQYLPTLALFENGELVAMESGAPPESQLRQWIDAHVDTTAQVEAASEGDDEAPLETEGDTETTGD